MLFFLTVSFKYCKMFLRVALFIFPFPGFIKSKGFYSVNVANSCDEDRESLIRMAFNDAIKMTKIIASSTADFANDYMFVDLFGPKATDIVTPTNIQSLYSYIINKD